MRDGFRWSPDGKRIAYWQLDATGVRDFLLINNTDSLYSFTDPGAVSQGRDDEFRRARRRGERGGGPTTLARDSRRSAQQLPRAHGLGRRTPSELIVQQLNRRQTQNTFWVATPRPARREPLFVERDSAWIDIYDDHRWGPGPSLHWLADGSAFV